ncbi:MAG: hypothetical protein ACYS1A_19685 [Planctomycetota bacterium]|jgi:hypothetical protein
MKKAERIIVYGIAILAISYSIWANGKLQRIYRINRKNPSYYMPPPTRGTGCGLRQLCLALGELELTGRLKDPSLSEGTRHLLIARLSNNIKFYLNSKWMFSSLEKPRSALIDAINAEIDVLSHESQMYEKDSSYRWYDDPVYKSLMDKSILLRSEASMQIYKKTEEI